MWRRPSSPRRSRSNRRRASRPSMAATSPRHCAERDAAVHTPMSMPMTCPPVEALVARFRDRSATVGIIGLGYVGLPLVQALLDNGLAVIGVDIDAGKVEALKEG